MKEEKGGEKDDDDENDERLNGMCVVLSNH